MKFPDPPALLPAVVVQPAQRPRRPYAARPRRHVVTLPLRLPGPRSPGERPPGEAVQPSFEKTKTMSRNLVRLRLVPWRHLRRLQRLAVRALRATLPGAACRQAAQQGSSCHCLLQCQTEGASRCWTHWPAPFCSALLTAGPNVRRTRPIALRSASHQDACASPGRFGRGNGARR